MGEESPTSDSPLKNTMKFINNDPSWKEMLRRVEHHQNPSPERYFNAFVQCCDGHIPFHHVVLSSISPELDAHISEHIKYYGPPTPANPLSFITPEVKTRHMRIVISILYHGKARLYSMEEKEDVEKAIEALMINPKGFTLDWVDGETEKNANCFPLVSVWKLDGRKGKGGAFLPVKKEKVIHKIKKRMKHKGRVLGGVETRSKAKNGVRETVEQVKIKKEQEKPSVNIVKLRECQVVVNKLKGIVEKMPKVGEKSRKERKKKGDPLEKKLKRGRPKKYPKGTVGKAALGGMMPEKKLGRPRKLHKSSVRKAARACKMSKNKVERPRNSGSGLEKKKKLSIRALLKTPLASWAHVAKKVIAENESRSAAPECNPILNQLAALQVETSPLQHSLSQRKRKVTGETPPTHKEMENMGRSSVFVTNEAPEQFASQAPSKMKTLSTAVGLSSLANPLPRKLPRLHSKGSQTYKQVRKHYKTRLENSSTSALVPEALTIPAHVAVAPVLQIPEIETQTTSASTSSIVADIYDRIPNIPLTSTEKESISTNDILSGTSTSTETGPEPSSIPNAVKISFTITPQMNPLAKKKISRNSLQ